ncbi:MAG: aminotransferase class I/II-fold pyridoxal phosphate-dependent enzyme, partial [Candidatus Thermofonsia bacterium]
LHTLFLQFLITLRDKGYHMNYMAQRVRHFGTTIFAEMTALANACQAVNLGQGFPDFAAPDFVKNAAQAAIAANINQYAPSNGRSRLRRAIAQKMETLYGRPTNPDTEILITHGATEAIFTTIMGLVNPGDEVILFEPYYDSYVPAIHMAGGIPKYYTLRPPHWEIDLDALAKLFTTKTKVLLLNTPHNPTGKVFTLAELTAVANLCQQHDVIVVADEVYEHIVFDSHQHHAIAALPGMDGRTVTISSLGKTFSATGWKVGWTVAAPHLTQVIMRVHQFVTYSGAAPLQEATAVALETASQNNYYQELRSSYQQKRDHLSRLLTQAGFTVIQPHGTYFLMVDIRPLGFKNDVEFCQFLTKEVGVAAIPPSAFY